MTVDPTLKSLLHFSGSDGSTIIEDEMGKVWTANGNAQLDTSYYRFGPSSVELDGVGDWIDTPDHADWLLGANNFHIDFGFRRLGGGGGGPQVYMCGQADSTLSAAGSSFLFSLDDIYITFKVSTGSAWIQMQYAGGFTSSLEPHHCSFGRDGNYGRLFLDGFLRNENSTFFSGVTVPNSAGKLSIGRAGDYNGNYYQGGIDEFRFRAGTPGWTERYQVPFYPFTKNLFSPVISWVGGH